MHADERGGVAGGGKEVATVAAREGGNGSLLSHAKLGLSQTFGTYCWADLADLSVT